MTKASKIARKACHRTSLPCAARTAVARISTSAGIGMGTPTALVSMMMKIAARPYWMRNMSIPFMSFASFFIEAYGKRPEGDYSINFLKRLGEEVDGCAILSQRSVYRKIGDEVQIFARKTWQGMP